jgi:flagellar protein FliO/FliZ
LGGEKLNQHHWFFTVFLMGVGLLIVNLTPVSAQTPDVPGDSSALTDSVVSGAAEPSRESLIIFGDDSSEGAMTAPTSSSFFVVLRMVLALALAAAAIYGVVFLFKRLSRPPARANPYLRVLASAPLGPGSHVSVVSLGSNAWLVGASDGGVSLISEITDQELVDAMLLDESRRTPEKGGGKLLNFAALLRRLGGGTPTGPGRPSADSLRKRRERLKDL